MRAGILARVSSLIQRDAHTIDSQLRFLPDFVGRQGWKEVARYIEDGKSASSGRGRVAKRDGLAAAMADAAAGKLDVLVVVDMDRLIRVEDWVDRGAIIGAFQRAKVRIAIASTGEILDLNSSTGDLLTSLKTYFTAEWVRQHREKVLRGRREGAARGRKPAGQTPWGLRWDRQTGAWSIDEAIAQVIRELFRRIVAGESARALGLELEARGIRSPKGGRWGSGLHRIIRESVYRGEFVYDAARGQRITVPAIVDEALWWAAQDALSRSARGIRVGGGRARHFYLCAGRIYCGVCGHLVQVHSESPSTRGGRGAYYRCSGRRLPRDGCRCTLPMVQVAEVDRRVWAAIERLVQAPDFVERLAGHEDGEAAAWARDLETYQGQLAELERSEVAILDRRTRGLISDAAMDVHLGRMVERRRWLERQVGTARSASVGSVRSHVSARAAAAVAERLRDALGASTEEERRDLVRALVPGWGEHRVVLGADRVPIVGVLIPWSAVTSKGQLETAEQGQVGVSFRLVG